MLQFPILNGELERKFMLQFPILNGELERKFMLQFLILNAKLERKFMLQFPILNAELERKFMLQLTIVNASWPSISLLASFNLMIYDVLGRGIISVKHHLRFQMCKKYMVGFLFQVSCLLLCS